MERLLKSARVIIAAIGILGVFFAPIYVPLLAILLLSLRYRAWEALLIGLLLDLVWLPGLAFQVFPLYTMIAIGIVWLCEPLRVQLLR